MKDKKSIIDIYNTIYFVDIVIANKYTTLEELKEQYTYSDGVELDDAILNADCSTSTCKRIVDNKYCVLVKYNHDSGIKGTDKKVDFINSIAHEAGHVALDVYEAINQNICFCSPEPFCYLVGYAAECMYKTWTKNE